MPTPPPDPSPILLIDGAIGTLLDARGCDVALPLWSAKALIDCPETVEQIHIDYLDAGAEAITTCTFRTHRRSLAKAGFADRAKELTTLAVDIAKSARDKTNPDALILGCVSPLEDCYHPECAPDTRSCEREHEEMITNLLDAGADQILIETVNTRHESLAAAEQARKLAPGKWMISFCTKTHGPPGVMLRGAPLVDVLPTVSEASAVGINCVVADSVEPQIRLLRMLLPESINLLASGNIGFPDDEGNWFESDAIDPEVYADYAEQWIAAGATVIGGCCGTTPETIKAVAKRLGKAAQ